MEIYDVVKKLVGPISPIGETNTDEARFENLKVMVDLVDALLIDLDSVAVENKDHFEYSRKRAGEYASEAFNRFGIVE